MATRCLIASVNDGVVESIYCHWDGYPKGVGRTLYEYYYTPDLVKKLIDNGNLSTLDVEIESCQRYVEDALTYQSTNEFLEAFDYSDCEYAYLFDGASWHFTNKNPIVVGKLTAKDVGL